jgi:hypothetical protein
MVSAPGKFFPRSFFAGLALLALMALAGCAVGPNFKAPQTKMPEAYHSLDAAGRGHASRTTPQPAALGEWWQSFHDPILDSLVSLALASNLDLKQAEARVRQARAARGVAVGGTAARRQRLGHLPAQQKLQRNGERRGRRLRGHPGSFPGIIPGGSGCGLGIGLFRGHPALGGGRHRGS